jgi:hypothetical protein
MLRSLRGSLRAVAAACDVMVADCYPWYAGDGRSIDLAYNRAVIAWLRSEFGKPVAAMVRGAIDERPEQPRAVLTADECRAYRDSIDGCDVAIAWGRTDENETLVKVLSS